MWAPFFVFEARGLEIVNFDSFVFFVDMNMVDFTSERHAVQGEMVVIEVNLGASTIGAEEIAKFFERGLQGDQAAFAEFLDIFFWNGGFL